MEPGCDGAPENAVRLTVEGFEGSRGKIYGQFSRHIQILVKDEFYFTVRLALLADQTGTCVDFGLAPSTKDGIHIHGTAEVSFVSEYGGIGWSVGDKAWSYGNAPKTEEEFLTRLKGLTDALLDNPCITAYCYTQLTDIEQEQNGLYYYDRTPKFPPEVVHEILAKKAAIEE